MGNRLIKSNMIDLKHKFSSNGACLPPFLKIFNLTLENESKGRLPELSGQAAKSHVV
jgi:hypothetical protein